MKATTASSAKTFLRCGIFVAPLFYGAALIQLLMEPEFDLRRLPISFLSLGRLGWVQDSSFLICGLLATAFSFGLRRTIRGERGGTWGPILIGLYGIGMMMAGIFHPDPAFGFPPGAPAGMPSSMSLHAVLHMVAFFIAFIALIAGSFVFARRFALLRHRGWAIYSVMSGVAGPVLVVAGSFDQNWSGIIIASAGLVLFGWLSLLAVPLGAMLSWSLPSNGKISPKHTAPDQAPVVD